MDEATRALDNYDRESPEWREAATFTSMILLVDAEEMKWLAERIDELLGPYRSSVRDRAQIPAGARVAEAQVNLFARVARRPHGLPDRGRMGSTGAGPERGRMGSTGAGPERDRGGLTRGGQGKAR